MQTNASSAQSKLGAITSNRLPCDRFSTDWIFCLHRRERVVWKYLLGCSLAACWRKTAGLSSERAEAIGARFPRDCCYCICKSCGAHVSLPTWKKKGLWLLFSFLQCSRIAAVPVCCVFCPLWGPNDPPRSWDQAPRNLYVNCRCETPCGTPTGSGWRFWV